MAKIYTDVLMLGDGLAGLIAASLINKRGIKVTHFPTPTSKTYPNPTYPHALWPSYRDTTSRKVIDELEMNLDFTREFRLGSNFAFIEGGQTCIYGYESRSNPGADIVRAFKEQGKNFIDALEVVETLVLENAVTLASMTPIRPQWLNRLRHKILEKHLAYNTPLTTSANLNAAIDRDPAKLFSIKNFYPSGQKSLENGEALFAALTYKYGLTLPANPSISTYEALKIMFRGVSEKHGGIFNHQLHITEINSEKNKTYEAETLVGDTYVAQAIIDATHLGMDFCWQESEDTKPQLNIDPNQPTNYLSVKAKIDYSKISSAIPSHGFLFCPNKNLNFYCYYQLLSSLKNSELSTIGSPLPSKNQDESSRVLTLKIISSGELSTKLLIDEARRIICRYFSHTSTDKLELEISSESQCRQVQKNADDMGTLTKGHNQFRASPYLTSDLGIYGEFATGYSIYQSISKNFKYKIRS